MSGPDTGHEAPSFASTHARMGFFSWNEIRSDEMIGEFRDEKPGTVAKSISEPRLLDKGMDAPRDAKEGQMSLSNGMFAYLGPETMLPVTSAVAGLVGVVMLLGRGSWRWIAGMARSLVSQFKPRSRPRSQPQPRVKTRRIGKGPVNPAGSTPRKQARS